MEKIFTIVIIAIGTVFISSLVKKYAPEYSIAIFICASIIIVFFVIADIAEIFSFANNIIKDGNINSQWGDSVMKVTLISFAGQWGIGICRDAGETSVAEKIEMAVKIMILVICLPYIKMIFTVANEIS